ncbi:MAG: flagellar biosynthetic protein FliO [Armatimonadota bacterium]|nr:MAG: flagellar biosynthetic protein FliO [Armatimonadota bacterium]
MESVGLVSGIGVKVGLAVALAVGATAAARYLHLARHGWRPGRGGRLRVLETAVLGQNRAVHLVSVGRRTLFIASTASQVVMLADVTAEQEPVASGAATSRGQASRLCRDFASFASTLGQLLGPTRRATSQNDGAQAHTRTERLLEAARALRGTESGGWVG